MERHDLKPEVKLARKDGTRDQPGTWPELAEILTGPHEVQTLVGPRLVVTVRDTSSHPQKRDAEMDLPLDYVLDNYVLQEEL